MSRLTDTSVCRRIVLAKRVEAFVCEEVVDLLSIRVTTILEFRIAQSLPNEPKTRYGRIL